jgi:anti-sigma factor RsiW
MSSFGGLFEDHLSVDAVVAYVDGELSLVPFQRAAAHLQRCPMCAAEVSDQMFARDSLRSAATPRMPSSLLASLQSIPVALPAAAGAPGIRIDAATGRAVRIDMAAGRGVEAGTGRTNSTGRPPHGGAHVTRSRRFQLGAGAIVAGIAFGAFASGPSDPAEPGTPSVVPTVNKPVVQPAGLTVTDPASPTDR